MNELPDNVIVLRPQSRRPRALSPQDEARLAGLARLEAQARAERPVSYAELRRVVLAFSRVMGVPATESALRQILDGVGE